MYVDNVQSCTFDHKQLIQYVLSPLCLQVHLRSLDGPLTAEALLGKVRPQRVMQKYTRHKVNVIRDPRRLERSVQAKPVGCFSPRQHACFLSVALVGTAYEP